MWGGKTLNKTGHQHLNRKSHNLYGITSPQICFHAKFFALHKIMVNLFVLHSLNIFRYYSSGCRL